MVMPARLIRETEECEEDECTRDDRPAVKLVAEMRQMVGFPKDARDLTDPVIVQVDVGPAHVRTEPKLDVDGKNPRRYRDSPHNLDHRKTHQADVAALIEATVRRHKLAELTTASVEMIDGHNAVAKGHDTNKDRPQIKQGNGRIPWHN